MVSDWLNRASFCQNGNIKYKRKHLLNVCPGFTGSLTTSDTPRPGDPAGVEQAQTGGNPPISPLEPQPSCGFPLRLQVADKIEFSSWPFLRCQVHWELCTTNDLRSPRNPLLRKSSSRTPQSALGALWMGCTKSLPEVICSLALWSVYLSLVSCKGTRGAGNRTLVRWMNTPIKDVESQWSDSVSNCPFSWLSLLEHVWPGARMWTIMDPVKIQIVFCFFVFLEITVVRSTQKVPQLTAAFHSLWIWPLVVNFTSGMPELFPRHRTDRLLKNNNQVWLVWATFFSWFHNQSLPGFL